MSTMTTPPLELGEGSHVMGEPGPRGARRHGNPDQVDEYAITDTPCGGTMDAAKGVEIIRDDQQHESQLHDARPVKRLIQEIDWEPEQWRAHTGNRRNHDQALVRRRLPSAADRLRTREARTG